MAKTTAVVLSSGGLRSLVAAGIAAREHRIALLHIQDGRPTAAQAAIAFEKQIAHFQPLKAWNVPAPALRQTALPVESAGVIHSTSSDPHTPLIPLRDIHLLTIAAAFARQLRADTVIWGAQFDQKQPDAIARNVEFLQMLTALFDLYAPEAPVTIKTPLMGLEDQQVIELGYQIGTPFNASWTCQMAIDAPCMSCPACARRTRSFRCAQLVDPLVSRPKSKVE
ncbi:MAG TPA: 7-cyano-7-deazaguanine synthase [Phycisphaerae bacterium]|nr:7-cyano-7-deazaguanine synthase [Phycisphaerae bacterium]